MEGGDWRVWKSTISENGGTNRGKYKKEQKNLNHRETMFTRKKSGARLSLMICG